MACANAISATSLGQSVRPAAQCLKVDRKPCGTAATPMRRVTAESVTSESGPPSAPVKRCELGPPGPSARTRSAACRDRDTRCSRLAFILSAGTVQSERFRSISRQVAPLTSPERAAVRMANSSALAPAPPTFLRAAKNVGISSTDIALWWVTFRTLEGAGNSLSSRPRHLAGLSPLRAPCTMAQSRISSIRLLRREAVSVLSDQIGWRTWRIFATSMLSTSRLPITR